MLNAGGGGGMQKGIVFLDSINIRYRTQNIMPFSVPRGFFRMCCVLQIKKKYILLHVFIVINEMWFNHMLSKNNFMFS